jgi:hypothetical protein
MILSLVELMHGPSVTISCVASIGAVMGKRLVSRQRDAAIKEKLIGSTPIDVVRYLRLKVLFPETSLW